MFANDTAANMGKRKRRKKARQQRVQRQPVADPRAQGLLDRIERAFDGVPPPDDHHRTLYQAEAWDSYELIDQSDDHKGRWQDLPDQHLRDCQYALPHLDAQGMRYYLPALMADFVRAPESRRRWSYDSLLYSLGPAGSGLSDYRRAQLSLLTALQREAIAAYLRFIDAPPEVMACWPSAGDDERETTAVPPEL